MRVGLIYASHPRLSNPEDDRAPLGIGYLASYLRAHAPDVEVVIERDPDRLIEAKPDLVGLSYTTLDAIYAARLAGRMRDELGVPIVAGGVHISLLPTYLPEGFDVAVLGEGEQTFLELVELYRTEKRLEPASLARIDGLLYRDASGQLARTAARGLVKDLDQIPPPARDLLTAQWPASRRIASVLTGRGCPFNCVFCSTNRHWQRRCRTASDEYVLSEIEAIRSECDPETLEIEDDLFVVNKRRVLGLLGKIRERGLHEGMTLSCSVRTGVVDEEIMDALAATNFRVLHAGLESGSDRVLEIFNKTNVTAEGNAALLRMGVERGMQFTSCFLLGAPGERPEDILDTFDFMTEHAEAFCHVIPTVLYVLPATPLWDMAQEKYDISDSELVGIAIHEEDWEDPERFFYERWIYLNEENISRRELDRFRTTGMKIAALVERMAAQRNQVAPEPVDAASVARNVPFAEILREKVKRRLRRMAGKDDA